MQILIFKPAPKSKCHPIIIVLSKYNKHATPLKPLQNSISKGHRNFWSSGKVNSQRYTVSKHMQNTHYWKKIICFFHTDSTASNRTLQIKFLLQIVSALSDYHSNHPLRITSCSQMIRDKIKCFGIFFLRSVHQGSRSLIRNASIEDIGES